MRFFHLVVRHLPVFLTTSLLQSCISALDYDDDVEFCGLVLRDLESAYASDFCSSFAAIEDVTSFVTVSLKTETTTSMLLAPSCQGEYATIVLIPSQSEAVPIPISSTMLPTSTESLAIATPDAEKSLTASTTPIPLIHIVTVTTTITSTITVAASSSPSLSWASIFRKPTTANRREPSSFCPADGVPCRLIQYHPEVISEACFEFAKPETTLVTTEIEASTATTTDTSSSCATDISGEDGAYTNGRSKGNKESNTD